MNRQNENRASISGGALSNPARAAVCRIEFEGEQAQLSLERRRTRAEKQTFEVLVRSVKFEVRYELPRSRGKAMRTLKRGGFDSHTATADAITALRGKPEFGAYAHDGYRGYPRIRSTWRGLVELSEEEEEAERVSVFEFLSRDGYRAVTLEFADRSKLTVRSTEGPFIPQQFLEGPGKRLVELMKGNRGGLQCHKPPQPAQLGRPGRKRTQP